MMSSQRVFLDRHQGHAIQGQRRGQPAPPIRTAGMSAALLEDLQRVVGNQAVNRLLRQHADASTAHAPGPIRPINIGWGSAMLAVTPRVQRSEGVGPDGRPYAMKRDVAAESVAEMGQDDDQANPGGGQTGSDSGDQTNPDDQQAMAEQGGLVQLKAEVGMAGGLVSDELAARVEAARDHRISLDASVRGQMESLFGTSFADVGVHADGVSDALNRSVSAVAFTTGSDIFFKQGAYDPGSSGGRQLLAHELTHVVQQRGIGGGGRMRVGAAGDSYEQEANAMASSMTRTGPSADASRSVGARLQRMGSCLPDADQIAERATQTQNSVLSFLDEDDPGQDDDYLYQGANGTTSCDYPSGTPRTVINNTTCSGACTARHEAVHFSDIGPCCASAGNAYRAAANDTDRANVRTQFVSWLNTNRAWFECRAYAESVKCSDEQLAAQKCSDPSPADPACCNELKSYRTDKEQRRQANCASAGSNLTDCPFSGNSSIP